jgi:hypothetical protein
MLLRNNDWVHGWRALQTKNCDLTFVWRKRVQTGGGSQPKHPTVATERDPRCDHLAPLSVPCTRPDTRVPLERRELEIRWGSTPRRRRRHGDVPEPDLNRTTRAPLHFYMGGTTQPARRIQLFLGIQLFHRWRGISYKPLFLHPSVPAIYCVCQRCPRRLPSPRQKPRRSHPSTSFPSIHQTSSQKRMEAPPVSKLPTPTPPRSTETLSRLFKTGIWSK